MRRVILLGAAVIILAGVAGYLLLVPNALDLFTSKTVLTDQKAITKMTLGYASNPYPDDYQVMRIPGYVDNLGNKRIISAKLQIQLTDSEGNRKELVNYDVQDIAPRSRKSFDANAGTFSGPRKSAIKIVQLEVQN